MTAKWWLGLALLAPIAAFAEDPAAASKSVAAPAVAAAPQIEAAPARFASAVAYNDWIVERQTEVGTAIMAFSSSFDTDDMAKIDAARAVLEETARRTRLRLETLPPFEGDATLKESALALFGFYVEASGGTYKEIVAIYASVRTAPDPAEVTRLSAQADVLIGQLTAREAVFDQAFSAAQAAFAARNGFSLQENALQQELDKLGE